MTRAFVRSNWKRKKNELGEKLCLVCDAIVPPRRFSYCSDECASRNRPEDMKARVYQRDKGICAHCGTSCGRRGFEMDHIVPVVEGGGLCGLDGYRTLCSPCHKLETKALAKRRAQQRRDQNRPLLVKS
jgi:5-methylcytosine-specific restriction endonuclease McrA